MVSPDSMHTNIITQTEKVVFMYYVLRYVCMYTCMHVIISLKRHPLNLKKNKEEYIQGFGGRKEKEEII